MALDQDVAAARQDPSKHFGKFLILGELGRGGMGVVYRAWQEDLRHVVALKVLPVLDDPEMTGRFLREAQIASSLRHPNIVGVHEYGEVNKRAFFTMDVIEGHPLSALIHKRRASVKTTLEIVVAVARALSYAHKKGVVHRDVKPQNILVATDGTPYLTDFGLARAAASDSSLTRSNQIMGSPHYMSPEQARGRQRDVTALSDIYSLGTVLYEALTGSLPIFRTNQLDQLQAIVTEDAKPPSARVPALPHDLDIVTLKCLEKEPARRYASAEALARDLERHLAGEAIAARTAGPVEAAVRWIRKRPAIAGGALVAVAILLAGALMFGRQAGLQSELDDLRSQLAKSTDPVAKRAIERKIADKVGAPAPPPDELPKPPADQPTGQPLPVDPPKEVSAKQPDSKWPVFESRVAGLLKREQFASAIKELATFVPASDDDRRRSSAMGDRILAEARDAFERLAAEAKELAAAGKLDEARALLHPFGIDSLDALVRDCLANLARPADVTPPPPNAAARDKAVDLCARRKYAEAAAAAVEFEPVIREAASVFAAIAKGAEAMKGKSMTFSVGRGEIRGTDGKELKVFVAEFETTIGIELASLRTAEVVTLAQAGGATPEAVGLFLLFEGRTDLARAAWAKSPRRAELDTFADAIGNSALEREAKTVLDALTDAARRKDWKKCRELLAQRERFAPLKSWSEAAGRIDEIASSSAEEITDPLYAVAPRKAGAGFEWSYDFSKPVQIRDWRLNFEDLWASSSLRRPSGYGWHLDGAAVCVRNARLEFLAPVEGDLRLAADLTIKELGQDVVIFYLAGYRWEIRSGSFTFLHAPSGRKLMEAAAAPFEPGRTYRAEFVVGRDLLRGTVDGRELFRLKPEEPPRLIAPSIASARNTTILVDRIVVSGTPRRGWPEAERARRALLAGIGRAYSTSAPKSLSDGKSFGDWRPNPAARWEFVEGTLRGTSTTDDPRDHAELHAEGHRNLRLKFDYFVHEARIVSIGVRMGRANVDVYLPVDVVGRWRTLEVVVVEGSVRIALDSDLQISFDPPELIEGGGLRLMLSEAKVSVRNATLEEIRNVPPVEPWVELFNGKALAGTRVGKSWAQDGELLLGSGEIESQSSFQELEMRLIVDGPRDAAVKITFRGAVLEWTVPAGSNPSLYLRSRGDQVEAWSGEVLISTAKLKPGPSTVKLDVARGTLKVRAWRVRGK